MEFFSIFIIGFIAVLIIAIVIAFNSIIKSRTHVYEGWSGIDVQLKRRYDLIPLLVETTKMYVTQEKGILTEITEARNKSMEEKDLSAKSALEDKISSDIRKVSVVVENYPQLKSSENFLKLMDQLFEIEDQLQMARRYYNGTVRNYNIKLKIFPLNIIASIFNFKEAAFFEADEKARQDVKVDL